MATIKDLQGQKNSLSARQEQLTTDLQKKRAELTGKRAAAGEAVAKGERSDKLAAEIGKLQDEVSITEEALNLVKAELSKASQNLAEAEAAAARTELQAMRAGQHAEMQAIVADFIALQDRCKAFVDGDKKLRKQVARAYPNGPVQSASRYSAHVGRLVRLLADYGKGLEFVFPELMGIKILSADEKQRHEVNALVDRMKERVNRLKDLRKNNYTADVVNQIESAEFDLQKAKERLAALG